jgi:hypothetical protein
MVELYLYPPYRPVQACNGSALPFQLECSRWEEHNKFLLGEYWKRPLEILKIQTSINVKCITNSRHETNKMRKHIFLHIFVTISHFVFLYVSLRLRTSSRYQTKVIPHKTKLSTTRHSQRDWNESNKWSVEVSLDSSCTNVLDLLLEYLGSNLLNEV